MARMLGTFNRPSCPHCRAAPGPDCAAKQRGKKAQRAREKRDWSKTLVDAIEEVFDVFTS